MSIEPKHLATLRCPVSKRPIDLLRASSLDRLNQKIQASEIKDNNGRTLSTPLEQALITDTGTVIYPIVDGVPVLIEADGIAASQIN